MTLDNYFAPKLDVLAFAPTDVLVLRLPDELETSYAAAHLQAELRKRGHDNLILVIAPGATIKAFDEGTMAMHGWYRGVKAVKKVGASCEKCGLYPCRCERENTEPTECE